MSMAKATVAKVGEAKAGGASGLLRKGRGVETELEAAESGPARVYPVDVNRVPLYPPGGPPARPVGWPGFANALARNGGEREDVGRDVEPAVSSKASSGQFPFAAASVFAPPVGQLATTRGVLQAKLEVGSVDDPLEEEADQVAERVLRMPDSAAATSAPEEPPGLPLTAARARLLRKCAACKEEDDEKGIRVQRRAAPGASAGVAEAPPIVEQTLRSGGRALDEETRAYFESRLRFDLSKVRVHTDARAAESARAVNALAYTVGSNIVFGQGRYAPGEREGRRLLAHELAHVAQQGSAAARPWGRPAVTSALPRVSREAASDVDPVQEKMLNALIAAAKGDAAKRAAAVAAFTNLTVDQATKTAHRLNRYKDDFSKYFWHSVAEGLREEVLKLLVSQVGPNGPIPTPPPTKEVAKPAAPAGQPPAPTGQPPAAPVEQPAAAAPPQSRIIWIDTGDPSFQPPASVPQDDPRYVDNKATAVAWSVQMGHLLILFGNDEIPLAIDWSMVNPSLAGPLTTFNDVFDNQDDALKNLGTAGYGFSWTVKGNTIIPTAFGPASTPRIMKMIEDLRAQIAAYAKEMMDLFTIQAAALGGTIVLQVAVPALVNTGIRKLDKKFQAAPTRRVSAPPSDESAVKKPTANEPAEEPAPPAKVRQGASGEADETELPNRSVQPSNEEVFEAVLWRGKDRDGHDLIVTNDLRFFRCTTCEELELTYAAFLDRAMGPSEPRTYRETLESIRNDFNEAKALSASDKPEIVATAPEAQRKANERLEELANSLAAVRAQGGSEEAGSVTPASPPAPAAPPAPTMTEADAEGWLQGLRDSLSDAGKKKLNAISRGKTAIETRRIVEREGGKDYLEGTLKANAARASAERVARTKASLSTPAVLQRPEIKKWIDARNALELRGELAVELSGRNAAARFGDKPGTSVIYGVKVVRRQPGYTTIAQYKAANPNYKGPVYEIGRVIWTPDTDLDVVVIQKMDEKPAQILYFEQVKSGKGVESGPGAARAQLNTSRNALVEMSNGSQDLKVMVNEKDVTHQFDLPSAGNAEGKTVGTARPPATDQSQGQFDRQLEVTSDELLEVAKQIINDQSGKRSQ